MKTSLMRGGLVCVLAALAMLGAVGCGISEGAGNGGGSAGGSSTGANATTGAPAGGAKTIKIGYVASLSGWLADFEDSFVKELRLEAAQINESGGVDGKYKIQLTIKDGKSDPAQGAIAAQQLSDSSIMFGPCDQDVGLPAAQAAQRLGIPFISSCAGASQFTDIVKPTTYLSLPGTWADGSAMAQFALSRGYKRAYLLYSKSIAYLQSVGEAFHAEYPKEGGKIVGTTLYSMNQAQYSTQINQIANAQPKPQVIAMVAITPDSIAMLRELASADPGIPVLLPYGNETNLILQPKAALARLSAYVLGLSPIPKPGTPLAKDFAAFKAKYGQAPDPTQTAMALDDMAVVKSAVTRAGSTAPKGLQTALQQTHGVKGVTGPITYARQDGRPRKNYVVVKVTPHGFVQQKVFFPSPVYHP